MATGEKVYIGLGSNVGDRLAQIRFGVERLRAMALEKLVRLSSLYESEPWGGVEQDPFLNCIAEFKTAFEPSSLFKELKWIEREAGRREEGVRWGARELDLDILMFGERRIVSPELTVPHPYLTHRRFVLIPLAELSPETIIPGHYIKVEEALRAVEDPGWVKPYMEGINL